MGERALLGGVRAQVVAIAAEVKAAQLRLGLADQVALAEENFIVLPAQRLARASVAPSHERPPRARLVHGERLEGGHLDDDSLAHRVIV